MSPSKERITALSTSSEHLSPARFTEARVNRVSSCAHFQAVMAVVHSSSASKDDDKVGKEPFSADSSSTALLTARQAVEEPSAKSTTSTSITLSRSSFIASCTSCTSPSPSPSPSAKCNLQVNPNSCDSSSCSPLKSVHSQHDHAMAHPALPTVGVTCPLREQKEFILPSRRIVARCHRPLVPRRRHFSSVPLLISILITLCATSKCPHSFSFFSFFFFVSFLLFSHFRLSSSVTTNLAPTIMWPVPFTPLRCSCSPHLPRFLCNCLSVFPFTLPCMLQHHHHAAAHCALVLI